jgi:hypothetical protein
MRPRPDGVQVHPGHIVVESASKLLMHQRAPRRPDAVMRDADTTDVWSLSRIGKRVLLFTLLGVALLGTSAHAGSRLPTTLTRCGYAGVRAGRTALYPWHLSCATARKVLRGSNHPSGKPILIPVAGGPEAVRIDGRYWVCGGQMGYDFCGYPYRRVTIDGEPGLAPFTKYAEFEVCSEIVPRASGCPKRSTF